MTLVRLFLIFLIVFSCDSPTPKVINQVEPPWGYVFEDWEGSPIDVITYIPPDATEKTPLLMVIPLQFIAYYLSIQKNINPDYPKNLAKTVVVE